MVKADAEHSEGGKSMLLEPTHWQLVVLRLLRLPLQFCKTGTASAAALANWVSSKYLLQQICSDELHR